MWKSDKTYLQLRLPTSTPDVEKIGTTPLHPGLGTREVRPAKQFHSIDPFYCCHDRRAFGVINCTANPSALLWSQELQALQENKPEGGKLRKAKEGSLTAAQMYTTLLDFPTFGDMLIQM